MLIDQAAFPFPLDAAFVAILENERAKAQLPAGAAVTLHFRDPGYSPETGGFHPVEIRLSSRGRIEYITDFAYVGIGPFAELAKEIDFDVSLGLFQHYGREFPIERGRELFLLWEKSFVSYYHGGVYAVDCVPD